MSFKSVSKPIIIVGTAGTLVLGVGNHIWRQEHRPKLLDVYVFNLISGRSMFIRTPDDKRILVDGGGNADVIREVTQTLPFYSRRIDVLIATNSEAKNISGLIDILDRYHVSQVFVPAVTLQSLNLASSSDGVYETFLEKIQSSKVQIREISAGQTIDLDSVVRFTVLFPTNNIAFKYSKSSAPEVLFDLSYGNTSINFLGNASVKVQKFIASTTLQKKIVTTGSHSIDDLDTSMSRREQQTDGRSILILSHSALSTNVSTLLVQKLQPDYLIYSKAIRNTTKISKTEVKPVVDPLAYINRSRRFNVKEIGTVHIISDGKATRLKSEESDKYDYNL